MVGSGPGGRRHHPVAMECPLATMSATKPGTWMVRRSGLGWAECPPAQDPDGALGDMEAMCEDVDATTPYRYELAPTSVQPLASEQ